MLGEKIKGKMNRNLWEQPWERRSFCHQQFILVSIKTNPSELRLRGKIHVALLEKPLLNVANENEDRLYM